MNNEMTFSDVNDFYSATDFKQKTKIEKEHAHKKINVLKVLLIVLGFVLVAEAFVYAVLMPCLSPVKITYTGLETFSPQQVSEYLQITPKLTWMHFDSAMVAAKLASNVVIENVDIQKRFPDQVAINIVERKAAAVTLVNVNNKTVPVQIDKNGVIFAVGRGMPKGNVPLVTGFSSSDNVTEGMRVDKRLRPLMAQIASLSEINPAYFAIISEIRVLPKDYGSYELEIYPANSNLKVLVDRTLNEETLQYMIVMLDVLNSMDANISTVDMRYGSISYR